MEFGESYTQSLRINSLADPLRGVLIPSLQSHFFTIALLFALLSYGLRLPHIGREIIARQCQAPFVLV